MTTTRTPSVGSEIRELMRERRIGVTELARQLGWGRMTLHRRLNDDPEFTVGEYQQVARALGLRATFRVEVDHDDTPAEVTA